MAAHSKQGTIRLLDRINLRLAAELFEAIDAACAARPGSVSRNTWITEAIQEKLDRDLAKPQGNDNRLSHG